MTKAKAPKHEAVTVVEAQDIVNSWIDDYEKKLQAIAKSEKELDPILIDGETEAGYYCHIMADPRDAAKIMLKYDYPIYRGLGKDAPDEMWHELGRFYGLGEVCSVDL